MGLDTAHFNYKSKPPVREKNPDEEVFCENSKFSCRKSLKKRLLTDFGFESKCSSCGIDSWLGKPLSLELDHINGVNNDHRIHNLRFLCPNCHSLTPTFKGRNRKPRKIESKCLDCQIPIFKGSERCVKCQGLLSRSCARPGESDLFIDIVELGFYGTGKKYGVSDNSIRKWCKSYGLPSSLIEIKKWFDS
jgi:5-methylcytosine-specific restriction endonuclease McrA